MPVGRRALLAAGAALAATGGRAQSQSQSQDALLRFDPLGQVTLLHVADLHAQLLPTHLREPEGPGFLAAHGIAPGSAMAHALAAPEFEALARRYGPMGGLDRLATLIRAIRAGRPANTLLLDGGDAFQGSWTALQSRGAEMADALDALGVDATTGHWEFTYGADRVKELAGAMRPAFLAGNVLDTEWQEEVFEHTKLFERGGVPVAVIGQAFPYTPIANPRHLIPDWSFGIREERLRDRIAAARGAGAALVVLLSHNGLAVDRKLAERIEGLDVILAAHTHEALPAPVVVGRTLILASGSHGRFLGRLDLRIEGGRVAEYRHALIPVFADAIAPDPAVSALVARLRAPHAADLARVVGRTEATLFRRGTLNGTMDDLICAALLRQTDAEIALSPGFRWGPALPAGRDITAEDVWAQTAITYPGVWRRRMSGAALKALLEDVADNLFNPDPYLRQGGDMVRAGGLGFTLDPSAPMGRRVGAMTLLGDGRPVEPGRDYAVAGWASVAEGEAGPPVWEAVFAELARGPVLPRPEGAIRLRG